MVSAAGLPGVSVNGTVVTCKRPSWSTFELRLSQSGSIKRSPPIVSSFEARGGCCAAAGPRRRTGRAVSAGDRRGGLGRDDGFAAKCRRARPPGREFTEQRSRTPPDRRAVGIIEPCTKGAFSCGSVPTASRSFAVPITAASRTPRRRRAFAIRSARCGGRTNARASRSGRGRATRAGAEKRSIGDWRWTT